MSRRRLWVYGLLGAFAVAGAACNPPEEPFPNNDELDILRGLHTPSPKPPADLTNKYADDARAVALGSKLFFDKSLSGCGTVACSSCHGGEGLTVSDSKAQGCGDYTGRNPPTVLNAGYATWFMWDGRADRLWNQALLPLTSPIEMASDANLLRTRLSAGYADEYQALFGVLPSAEADDQLLANFGKTVAAYERTLNRTDAPFDQDVVRFLQAVDAGTEEKDPAYLGLKTFVRKGQCAACHKGPSLSDDQFHNIGVKDTSSGNRGAAATSAGMLAWKFNSKGTYSDDRAGDQAMRLDRLTSDLEQKPADFEGAFKTPTLRNLTLTAPYMHTGELATLEDVVELYNKGGEAPGNFAGVVSQTIRKRNFTEAEKKALVDLLKSMTGAPPQP